MKVEIAVLFVTCSLIACDAACAQADVQTQSAFKGPYVQVQAGYQYNRIAGNAPSLSSAGVVYVGTSTGSTSAKAALLSVNGGYAFELAPKWRLFTGVEHQFIDDSTRSVMSDFNGQGGFGQIPYFYQVSDETNFFLAPGYVLSKGKIVFIKAGYSFEALSLNAVDSKARNSSGYVVGIGYKQSITNRFYATTEVHYSGYGKVSPPGVYGRDATLTATTGTFGTVNVIVGFGFKIRK